MSQRMPGTPPQTQDLLDLKPKPMRGRLAALGDPTAHGRPSSRTPAAAPRAAEASMAVPRAASTLISSVRPAPLLSRQSSCDSSLVSPARWGLGPGATPVSPLPARSSLSHSAAWLSGFFICGGDSLVSSWGGMAPKCSSCGGRRGATPLRGPQVSTGRGAGWQGSRSRCCPSGLGGESASRVWADRHTDTGPGTDGGSRGRASRPGASVRGLTLSLGFLICNTGPWRFLGPWGKTW